MTKEVKKLWQIDTALHPLVQSYTAGDDVIYDQQLVPYDVQGSKAHAKMLLSKGVINKDEYKALINQLDKLLADWQKGEFVITEEQEDAHTAIEQYLTSNLGDAGKKIHTGRSRNDQTTLMVRLYCKEQMKMIADKTKKLVKITNKKAKKIGNVPMPGYTHTQKAMPTSVNVWLGSYADAWQDCLINLEATNKLLDQNPLGSASGFGISNFDNDRELTTKELGFAKIQENPQYVGLSRGLFESSVLQSASHMMLINSRFASDMILFTTKEFGFFSLPNQFTTGSSIMPNKRNYDLFEIMRANTSTLMAAQQHVAMTYMKLVSGYNRDLQTMKGSLLSGLRITNDTLDLLTEVIPELIVNETALKEAMTDELFVTERVYDLVNQAMPFREAYLQIKKDLKL